MSGTSLGRIDWNLSRDDDGHRTYKIKFLVKCTSATDGPVTALTASGIPAIGATWAYGSESDPWAFCIPQARAEPVYSKEPGYYWTVENTFTTKPLRRCQTSSIENPLSEPQKVSGSFVEYTRQAEQRSDGSLILSSSHEKITGIEMDSARATVVVEQNVSALGLDTFTAMIHTLNDATLWGLATRKIKLSRISWDRKLYGTCTYYYTRRFEFDVRFDGFDIDDIADTGYKVFDDELYADTAPNRADPTKYKLAKDTRGDNPPQRVLLDGNGSRLTDPLTPVFIDTVTLYGTSNFLLLGIPTSL